MKATAEKIGVVCGITHFALFVFVTFFISTSRWDVYGFWLLFSFVIDFPLSLLNFLSPDVISQYIDERVSVIWLGRFLYPPSIIHGLLGSLWWFILPRLVTPKRLGGIW